MGEWVLTHYDRPWTLNVERQGNQWKRAKLVKEWRQAFFWLAREAKIPLLRYIEVEGFQTLRNRSSQPDTCACVGAVKAAIDGVVQAGALPDDGPEYVRYIGFPAPEVTGTDALILTIRGEPAEET